MKILNILAIVLCLFNLFINLYLGKMSSVGFWIVLLLLNLLCLGGAE